MKKFLFSLITLLFAVMNISAQTDFQSFSIGSVNYQGPGGTIVTGAGYTIPNPYGSLWTVVDEWGFGKAAPVFDQAVKDDGTGNKVLRISNAVISNSFSFHTNSPNSPLPAGEMSASLWNDRGPIHTAPTGPAIRAAAATKYFNGGFRFKSATGVAQPGLSINISPTARQSDRRNSYIDIIDNGSTGFNIRFFETLTGGGFSPAITIATNLSYTAWHRVDIYIEFVDGLNGDGSGNDIVTVVLDGASIHTGTTWETFYRVATPTTPIGAVDALMFRVSGTAAPATSGNGFYFDDVVYNNLPVPPFPVRVYTDNTLSTLVGSYNTIQFAINAGTTLNGHVVVVDPGTYNENVTINKNNLTLRSSGGKALTTIAGISPAPGAAAVMIAGGTNGVTLGQAGKGFTIIGVDGNGAIESAAIYLLGAHTNITIEGNEIRANGDHGLLSNYNAAIDGVFIKGNEFTGQTFTGTTPGDCGFGSQFVVGNNVPRQLVTMGGGAGVTDTKNISFINNLVTGTAGGSSAVGSCATTGQGNNLVSIDVVGCTISGNTFDGVTTGDKSSSLRTRGPGASIYCNTFKTTNLGPYCYNITLGSSSPLVGASPNTLAGIASSNSFPDGGAYLTPNNVGIYVIFRDLSQVAVLPGGETAVGTASSYNCPVVNLNTGLSYLTIQSAINATQTLNGHTIAVSPGTYNENVSVTKGVTLQGAGNTTVLTPTTACSGNGITISANNVQVNNLKVTNYTNGIVVAASNAEINGVESIINCTTGIELGHGISGLLVDNSKINGNGSNGLRSGTGAQMDGITIDHSEVKGNVFGMNIFASPSTNLPNRFDNISIKNSDFSYNSQKGMYFEKLRNAVIENVIMDNSGTNPGYKDNNGIDINLKYGTYASITIRNSEITNCGVNGTATDPEAAAAITIKARDDAGSYNSFPATLNDVTVVNNIISGPQNGLRFGEYGKTNLTPTNVEVHENSFSGPFANKALINRTPVTTDATCNWYGTTNAALVVSKISGSVTFVPYLSSGADASPAIGFQTTEVCASCVVGVPACSITGASTVCPSSLGNTYNASAGMNSYLWSISGNGSIEGSTTDPSVSVTAGANCGQSYTLTVTITNANGCQSTCSKVVMVQDIEAPVIGTLPGPTTINCPVTPSFTTPSVTDACDAEPTLTSNDVTTAGSCAGNYSITRTWTALDACGNSSTKSQTIHVQDVIAPSLTGTAYTDATVYNSCKVNAQATVPAWTMARAIQGYTDNCGAAVTATLTGTATSGTDCNWTVTYTYTIYDECLNPLTSRTYIHSGKDQTVPLITCKPNQLRSTDAGQCYYTAGGAEFNPASYSDNCGGVVTITNNYNNTSTLAGAQFPIGTTTVVWTAKDACNNSATCSFTITVSDNQNATGYIIYATTEAKFGENNYIGGDVGVTDIKGKADFKKYDVLDDYTVRAANISFDLPSLVNYRVYIPANDGPSPVPMIYSGNTTGLSNINITTGGIYTLNYKDVTVKKGISATLTADNFGKITVEEGASLSFTNTVINLEELNVQNGKKDVNTTNVIFSFPATVKVKDKVKIEDDCRVNVDGPKVTFYLADNKKDDEKFTVKGENTQVTCNIVIPNGKLKVEGGKEDRRTFMTGWYVIEKLDAGGKFIHWNRYGCNTPAFARPSYVQTEELPQAPVVSETPALKAEAFSVRVSPNPSSTDFKIQVNSPNADPVIIRIMDAAGMLQSVSTNVTKGGVVSVGSSLRSGTYFAEITQGNNRQVVRLVKLN